MNRLQVLLSERPKTTSLGAGLLCALAMAPFNAWPCLMLGLSTIVLIIARIEKPSTGAWCGFAFAMGFFTAGLWWVANALSVDLAAFWWAVPFAVLGLPVLLSVLWAAAGYIAVRFSKPGRLARGVLFLTLLGVAEYGRAFNFSGFPWNLFGYTWAAAPQIAQVSALGGIYFVNTLTLLWMAAPALLYLAPRKNIERAIAVGVTVSFAACFMYGYNRLQNPAEMRTDTGVVIIQPNISPADKWLNDKLMDHLQTHVDLSRNGLDLLNGATPQPFKNIVVVWPETSLDQRLMMTVPDAPRAILQMFEAYPSLRIALVGGLMREDERGYYNSIASVSASADHKLNLDDVYDKHHLVPFGEYVPLEDTLHLTPLVGFAGFQSGPGPRALSVPGFPRAAPLVCYEAIFPWYAKTPDAEWLVNVSNDGWYGDTPGPYQNLVMTQFRAIEQGKPVIRSATTGVSAIIDSYGRVIKSLAYGRQGFLAGALPRQIQSGTFYGRAGETLFFVMSLLGFTLSALLIRKEI